MHPFADVSARVLNRRISIHIAQLAQTKPITIIRRICESVNHNGRRVTMKNLADPAIQLVIRDGRPERLLLVRNRLHIRHVHVGTGVIIRGSRVSVVRRAVSRRGRLGEIRVRRLRVIAARTRDAAHRGARTHVIRRETVRIVTHVLRHVRLD